MKISIITQIRNESKRLKEWVKFHDYYYNIDLFLFYLDNPEDDSELVLKELKKDHNIEYTFTNPFGEYRANDCTIATHRQRASFTEGFQNLRHNFDWIGIFDVDEWLVPVDINNFDLRKDLSETNENILYIPMYNFKPPFDYNKSITEQNFYRWSCEERSQNGAKDCGKSIVRGKIYLNREFEVDIHFGPSLHEYRNGVDYLSKGHKYRLHQFQNHLHNQSTKYEIFDNTLNKLFNNIKK